MEERLMIREETNLDYRIVEQLTREAFFNVYVLGCDEHLALHNLRKHKDFIPELSFVAEANDKIVGHICYSKASIIGIDKKKMEVISFGPISVEPELQKRGIGSELIKYSLNKAKEMGYTIVVIYGDPRYYSRFGFHCGEAYHITAEDGMYAACLLVKELKKGVLKDIQGSFKECEGLSVSEKALETFEKMFPPKEKKETESQKVFQVLSSLRYQIIEEE